MSSSSDPQAAPSKPSSVTGRLSTWVHSLQYADIPDAVIERAKYLILDGLACALVGAKLPWTVRAVSALRSLEPAGPCSLIGWGPHVRVSATTACLLNSTSIQAFEFDEFHSRGPIHSNAILIPALLAAVDSAACQSSSASSSYPDRTFSGTEFLRAFIIGHEIGPRVGIAIYNSDMLARGWHPGSVQGPLAAAASVSTLLGLNARQIEWAIGTGSTQSGGLTSARFGSDTKRMQHGFAARNGLTAAYLSREGFVGIEDVFEIPNGGFLSVFGQGSTRKPQTLPDKIVEELGTTWEIESAIIKLHAAMGCVLASIDAVSRLQSKHKEKFKVEYILKNLEHVKVEMSNSMFKVSGWIAPRDKPLTVMSAQTSVQYSIAAQLANGQVLMKQYDKDNLNRPLLRELMDRIEPVANPRFDERLATKFATRINMRFKDGTVLEDELEQPVSFSASKEDILRKWRALAGDILSDEQRNKIENLVLGLDKLNDMTELTSALSEEVQCSIEV